MVTDGRITRAGETHARGCCATTSWCTKGKIASLRRFKDDVSEVKSGFECGIGLERYNDIKVGDVHRGVHDGARHDRHGVVMAQGHRPDRVGEEIRDLISRDPRPWRGARSGHRVHHADARAGDIRPADRARLLHQPRR